MGIWIIFREPRRGWRVERIYCTCQEVKAGSCERKSLDHAAVFQDGCIQQKKEQRKETELDETCYESNSKYRR